MSIALLQNQLCDSLFEWPGPQPAAVTVELFAGDTVAAIAADFASVGDFCQQISLAGYTTTVAGGACVRVGWSLSKMRRAVWVVVDHVKST